MENRTTTDLQKGAQSCAPRRWQAFKQRLNSLAPREFARHLQNGQAITLIDVRTPEEYQASHLPGAINISYLTPDLWDQLEQLPPQGRYYVYCRTERRALRVCLLMQNGGFGEVYNLDGGLLAWEQEMGAAYREAQR